MSLGSLASKSYLAILAILKFHPSISALIVKKMTLEMPLEKGWTFEISACNTGFNC